MAQNRYLMQMHTGTILFLLLASLLSTAVYGQNFPAQNSTEELRRKIGQMFIVGVDKTTLDDSLRYDLKERSLGGVIYFANNVVSPSQVKALSDSISAAAHIPPFIAIDQEGGLVARLKNTNGFEKTYTAYRLGSILNKEDTTRAQAAKMAGWLHQSGINVNFAPVVDVMINPKSPGLAEKERVFSKDADTVYYHAFWSIDEYHNRNIITSLKHFPGHGSAVRDSHLGLPDISKTWSDYELEPYRKLIASGYSDAIMVAHLYNSQIDPDYPTSLSYKTITGLLRGSLGYQGLVITDELTMGAITSQYQMEKAAELAINAGADILLYRMNDVKVNDVAGYSLLARLQDAIVKKVQEGVISASRIDESYNRIISLKNRYLNTVAVKDHKAAPVPSGYALHNYPNPFNPETIIMAEIPEDTEIDIRVYDIQGRQVKEIAKGSVEKGTHRFSFNGAHLTSGVYLVRLTTPGHSLTSKIMLIK